MRYTAALPFLKSMRALAGCVGCKGFLFGVQDKHLIQGVLTSVGGNAPLTDVILRFYTLTALAVALTRLV